MYRARVLAAAFLLIALGTPVFQTTTAGANSDDANCFANSATGSAHTRICVSSHGNISTFTTGSADYFPADQFRGEGYALCSDAGNTVHAWDAGDDEAGWTDHTTTDPGPVITRYTADGALKLTQSYAFNLAEGEVNITMEVKNVGSTSLPKVIVSRYFAPTIAVPGGKSEEFGETGASAFLWYTRVPGLKLNALTWNTRHETFLEFAASLSQGTDATCVPPQPEAGLQGEQLAGRVNFNIGTLNPGDKKTLVYKYERL